MDTSHTKYLIMGAVAMMSALSVPAMTHAQSIFDVPGASLTGSYTPAGGTAPATTPVPGSNLPNSPVNTTPSNSTGNNPGSSYTLLEPLPCIQGYGVSCSGGSGSYVSTVNFQQYIQYIFNLIIALAAASAVFMITYGGFQYMTTDSWQGKSDGLDKVRNAVYGLLLVLASYLILRTLDPRLVQIPTTLVTPLGITPTNQINAALNTVNNISNQFAAQTQQYINSNATLQNDINTQEDQKNVIADQISQQVGTSLSDDDLNSMCSDSTGDTNLDSLCASWNQANAQEETDTNTITTQSAKGDMDAVIEQCGAVNTSATTDIYGNQRGAIFDVGNCIQNIQKYSVTYQNQLIAAGDPEDAQQVKNYTTFATNMATINATVVKNMAQDPNAGALLQSAETAILTGTTIGGAVVGGGVTGAAAGFTAGALLNGALSGNQAAKQATAAQNSINSINSIVNNTVIPDPVLQQQMVSLANSIKQGLSH